MADFVGGNEGSRAESDKTMDEFENETMSSEDLNSNSHTVGGVDRENSARFVNAIDDSSVLQKLKLNVGESEKNDAFTGAESAIVDNGIENKIELETSGDAENGKVHSGNGSVPFENGDLNFGDEEISGKDENFEEEIGVLDTGNNSKEVKDENFEEENGVLDTGNNSKEVKDVSCVVEEVTETENDVHDAAGNEVEESGTEAYEHQAVETEKEEYDISNGRSLEREEDGMHADVAEGAELEEGTNAKVELEPEQEEKAKSELACENGEVETVADVDKLDDVSTDSNSVTNDNSASGVEKPSKPVNEEPVKTRSWRDIAVDGMDWIPDKVQFTSRNPMVRRSVPKFVKSVVSSVDLKSKIESKVRSTRSIIKARISESVSNIKDSTSEEKLEQVAKQKDCKLKFEAEKGYDDNVGANLCAKSKGSEVGQKYFNTSKIAGIDKEEQVKENKQKKEKEEKARKEEKLRKRKEAEEEKLREDDAKKERLRKEDEAAELRKKLIAEEIEKMRKAEERKKKKKAEKAQKRAEYKAQKEAEEKEKKKAQKLKKQSGTSDTSSVSSEVKAFSPEKNPSDASHDPVTSKTAVLKKTVVFPSSKKKLNIPKDPLPLPPTLRNRSKRKLMKGMWPLLVVFAVFMLFIAGNYISIGSSFQSFTF